MYNGFPSSAYIRNIKFVSNMRFTSEIGTANTPSSNKYQCSFVMLGASSPETASTTGYINKRMWTEKLCKCIKFTNGNDVQEGNNNAAAAPGIQIVYKYPLIMGVGLMQ